MSWARVHLYSYYHRCYSVGAILLPVHCIIMILVRVFISILQCFRQTVLLVCVGI